MVRLAQLLIATLWVGFVAGVAVPASRAHAAGSTEAQSDESCALPAVQRIQQRYDSIRDFSARFVQTSSPASLGGRGDALAEESSGHVIFAKPGKMRWTYEAPRRSVLASDGQTLWLYDVDEKEVQRLPAQKGYLTGAALEFLLGEGKLVDTFDVRAVACGAKEVELELVPKRAASYERLGLRSSVETGLVVETHIVDLLGNRTRIAFSEVETNRSPPAEWFRFEVPDGVEVIDLTPPQ